MHQGVEGEAVREVAYSSTLLLPLIKKKKKSKSPVQQAFQGKAKSDCGVSHCALEKGQQH